MRIFAKLREERLHKNIAKQLPKLDLAKKEEPKVEEPKVEEPKEPKQKPTGLKSQLSDIKEQLDVIAQEKKAKKEIKKKSFKLPFRVKSQLKRLALKRKVQVLLLQNNGNIKPLISEIKNGMLIIGDKLYDGSPVGLWLWNGKFPTMVVCEWDLTPLSRTVLYNDAVENKRLADPQTIIIRGMEVKELLGKAGMGGKSIIFIIIGAIVVFYILFAGG